MKVEKTYREFPYEFHSVKINKYVTFFFIISSAQS